MEEYKRYLFGTIYDYRDETIEQVENNIKDDPRYTINRNEEGKIHSRYLGNRYEPAIIKGINEYYECYYYLFDGDIKDCTHPFSIVYCNKRLLCIRYYSSERIKNRECIYINSSNSYYNRYFVEHCPKSVLSEYASEHILESNILKDVTQCNEIVETFTFKFVD